MNGDESLLDNPIWNALSTRQSGFALGSGKARRFESAIGPLSGLAEPSREAFGDLMQLLAPGESAILFLQEKPQLPDGWKLLRDGLLAQMICRDEPAPPIFKNTAGEYPAVEPLTPADVPAMIELVRLTEPGPFGPRTIELGGYLGVRVGGRLAAMAGQRLAPQQFTEVSAVCTHPDFRGRGYAQLLVASVAQGIRERGETPFLTLFASNVRASRVYETVGFVRRRTLELAIVAAPRSRP